VLGLAALNTGNNALYLLLSLLLGVVVASWLLSRHALRHLRVEVRAVGEVYASSPARLRLTVENRSRWLPAAGLRCRLVGMPGTLSVLCVPPAAVQSFTFATMFGRRGLHQLPALEVEVSLPLPFCATSVRIPQESRVLVYPRRVAAGLAQWVSLSRQAVQARRGTGERGGEVEQLREFRSGDDRRDIHWKQTARQQRLIVVERRERRTPSRYLVLDRQLPRRDDDLLAERFEGLVSEVASAALSELQRGRAVGLVVGSSVTLPATGPNQARSVLSQLAVVRAVGPGEDPLPPVVQGAGVYRLAGRRG
jgi:uncharacterized protein (DUF58 family)